MKTTILSATLVMLLFAVVGMRGEAGLRVSGKTPAAAASAQIFPTGGCFSYSSEEVTCGNGPVEMGGCGVGSKTTVQFVLGAGRQQLQTKVVTCAGASGCPPETVDEAVDNPGCCDRDGDGYASPSCGGSDCNDFNSAINPGATEDCNDRWDNDCDGDTNMEAVQNLCAAIGWYWFPATCTCSPVTPIIIDPLGNGFQLTDGSGGVNFDINGDGQIERLSWTAEGTDDAFLVLDRNGNNTIDDGTELFGNFTPQPSSSESHGFLALAEFDKSEHGGNADGVIDSRDSVYSRLRLWQDANHNGASELNEMHILPALNLETLSLEYKESRRRDRWGNEFRYRAKVYGSGDNHPGRWAYDVFLLRGN